MSTSADNGPEAGQGSGDGDDPMPPGLYEFEQFNRTVNRLPRETRATLHRQAYFDDADAMRHWLGGSMREMASHLNEHLREHTLFPAIASSAWLALRATRDGSEVRWYLRVLDGGFAARVGRMGETVAVIIDAPQDWVGAKAMPPAPGSIQDRLEDYLRDATLISPGTDTLNPPPVKRFETPVPSFIDRLRFLINPAGAPFSVRFDRPER